MRKLLVFASLAAVIGVATPAQADPGNGPDASFLAALDKAGITYHSPAAAIAVGRRACTLMDQGNPEYNVIQNVSTSNPGFKGDGADLFTHIAISVYCPQHLGDPATPPPPPPPNPGGIWFDLTLPALPAA